MPKTLDLEEVAAFLRMNPEALRQKVKAGIILGAKPGKWWVFLEDDIGKGPADARLLKSQHYKDRTIVVLAAAEDRAST